MANHAQNHAVEKYKRLIFLAGGKDPLRVLASGEFAVRAGDDPQAVLASLQRWQPQLFDDKLALRRQRREALRNQ